MKFQVTMKNPDVLQDAITDAVRADVATLGLADDETEAVRERRYEKVEKVASRWFEYGEYLTVEIDTNAGTCVVVEK